jgi:hypothetical protein
MKDLQFFQRRWKARPLSGSLEIFGQLKISNRLREREREKAVKDPRVRSNRQIGALALQGLEELKRCLLLAC